jgi:hypothetical protein
MKLVQKPQKPSAIPCPCYKKLFNILPPDRM